jgi:hypothetical protein
MMKTVMKQHYNPWLILGRIFSDLRRMTVSKIWVPVKWANFSAGKI